MNLVVLITRSELVTFKHLPLRPYKLYALYTCVSFLSWQSKKIKLLWHSFVSCSTLQPFYNIRIQAITKLSHIGLCCPSYFNKSKFNWHGWLLEMVKITFNGTYQKSRHVWSLGVWKWIKDNWKQLDSLDCLKYSCKCCRAMKQ